jgi:rhodanese-related sulfurtransferase
MDASVGQVTPLDLAHRMKRGDALAVLDVREPSERSRCAIAVRAGTPDLHVPLGSLPYRLDEVREAAHGRTLVVYCHHGVRSLMAVEWLDTQGIRVVLNLYGGIDAWSAYVDPTTPRY